MITTDSERKAARALYRARAKAQALAWAQGRPYHEPVNDECCPDFSCCNRELFEKNQFKRWKYYRDHYSE